MTKLLEFTHTLDRLGLLFNNFMYSDLKKDPVDNFLYKYNGLYGRR